MKTTSCESGTYNIQILTVIFTFLIKIKGMVLAQVQNNSTLAVGLTCLTTKILPPQWVLDWGFKKLLPTRMTSVVIQKIKWRGAVCSIQLI
jgi:hypothetical protein